MRPFYFGSSDCALYGMLHSALKQAENKNEAILLCYPFGQEYMRAHRTYRQIALALAKKGYHTMRFDYRGTGDSNGDLESVQPKQWLDDISVAIDELKESTRVEHISLIGLRMGAMLAGIAARTHKIKRLALWDPTISGSEYISELTARINNDNDNPRANYIDENGTLHFNGFSMSAEFCANLKEMDLTAAAPNAEKILQILSHEEEQFERIKQRFETLPGFDYLLAPSPGDWNYVDDYGGILMPQSVVQGIVEWF